MPSRGAIHFSGCLMFFALASVCAAQTVATAYSFQGKDGDQPNSIIQASDGNFYGTTPYGGGQGSCTQSSGASTGCGTIFEWVPGNPGMEYVIYAFTGGVNDGGVPTGLVMGPYGNLYGTTTLGGASINDGQLCTDPNTNDPPPSPVPNQPSFGQATYCCPNSGWTASVGCGAIFRMPLPPGPGSAETPVVVESFHGSLTGVQDSHGAADAFPGPMVPGVLPDGTTPVLYGTALPCSYCEGSMGSLFSFDPGSGTFTPLSLPVSSATFPYGYPTSVIQGLQCPTAGDTNCLYGTAQLTPSNFNCCGGVFVYDFAAAAQGYSDTGCSFAPPATTSAPILTGGALAFDKRPVHIPRVNTIVRQPGSGFPSDLEWTFTSVPIQLTVGSDGSILGTSPWACFSEGGGGSISTYSVGPACGGTDNATVFQCQPSAGTPLNTLYAFSDSGDGGGSTAGLTVGGDGNYYGSTAYGSGANSTTVNSLFQIPSLALGTALSTLAPYGSNASGDLGSGQAPVWMISANDGSFYGVSPTGGDYQHGAIFQVLPSAPLPAPVTVTVTPTLLIQGSAPAAATLTWTVANANSMTSRQCFAFLSGGSGGGSWSGAPTPTNTSSTYGGSTTITPTAPGNYTYALSCGGMSYGYATLQVNGSLSVANTTLTNATEEQPYSYALAASGGLAPYTWTVAPGALPAGLTMNTAGLVQGTPSVFGTFTFTVTVTDAESTPVTKSGQVALTINSDAPTVTLTASPNTGVVYGQTITLTATASPLPPASLGYAWSIYDGSTPLTMIAAGNTANGFTMTTPAQVGQHSYTASLTSTLNGYEPGNSSAVAVTVSQAPTTTTLTASSQNVNLNASATFTATVASTAGGTATGAVQFLNGTTLLATANLNGSTATYTTTSLAAATYSVTAAYQGDANYKGSTSSPVSVTVSAPTYSLSSAPPSLTVSAGGSTTSTITLTPIGGYGGTVSLTCSIPPAATYTTCSLMPAQLSSNGSNTPVTSTLTFTTNVGGVGSLALQNQPGPSSRFTMLAGSLAGLLLLLGFRRRNRWLRLLSRSGMLLALLATGLFISLAACGGGGQNTNGNQTVTPSGNYTIVVSASVSGSPSQTLNIQVTVN